MRLIRTTLSAILALSASVLLAGGLPPNSPPDKHLPVYDAEQVARLTRAIEPLVQQAKQTYPSAKARFLKGLPDGYTFSVVTRIHDASGRMEQVFVGVKKIKRGTISGELWSDINVVSGYRPYDRLRFPEADVIDWVITAPDGTEEGNVVGKWLDEHRGPY